MSAGLPGVGHDDHDDGYDGPALLVTATEEVPVRAALRGFFQPVHGRYQWHGRLSASPGVLERLSGRRHEAVLVTAAGEALCQVSEPDLWGRLAVRGTGTPPFPVDLAAPAA